MNEEEEAAARNIKLVRYTHPVAQNWKNKDGLERSRSLPVQQKKKSDGRLMDMLKSRSAKFHNLTVNPRSPGTSKDARSSTAKKQDACFLPVRTPNSVKPTPIPAKTVQRLNLDANLIPGNKTSNNVSFTSKVKKMLEEQRPRLSSIHKPQQEQEQEQEQEQPLRQSIPPKSINDTNKKGDTPVQDGLVRLQVPEQTQELKLHAPPNSVDDTTRKDAELPLTKCEPQAKLQLEENALQKPSEQRKPQSHTQQHQKATTGDENDKNRLEREANPYHNEKGQKEREGGKISQTSPDGNVKQIRSVPIIVEDMPYRKRHDNVRPQRQDRIEHPTNEEYPEPSETSPNSKDTSISEEPSLPHLQWTRGQHDPDRSDAVRLFTQVQAANRDANSESNFGIIEALRGKLSGKVENEEDEELDFNESQENDHSLQGCVIAFEGELGPPEDSGTSKLRLVYLSDEEEERRPRHKVLPPSSGVLRPASPRRSMPNMKDPLAEKRKNDREVAIEALAKLKEKKTFNRETFFQIIDKGVAEHRALESNPAVSVTNDVCSVNNYETSHAYYYQQFDRRSKLTWVSLHGPVASGAGKEPPKEIWKFELQAGLMGSTIFLHSIRPSNLSADQQHSLDHQIGQLKKLLQHKFFVKLSSSLEKKVDIVILYGQNEKVLNEVLQRRQDSLSRVWSLQKTLNYLQDIGINLQEWNIDKDAQDREPILDVPITEDSIQEDIEDSTEEEAKEIEEEIEEVVHKKVEKEVQKEPKAENEKGEREGEESQPRKEEPKQEKNESELKEKESQPAKKSYSPSKRATTTKGKPKPGRETTKKHRTTPKKVAKKRSPSAEESHFQDFLQQASHAVEKRDQQLKAAHDIILELSRDVMRQEIQITSLTGQLKNSETDIQRQSDLAQQYKVCMAEQEVEMAQLRSQLSKKKSKRAQSKNRVSKSP